MMKRGRRRDGIKAAVSMLPPDRIARNTFHRLALSVRLRTSVGTAGRIASGKSWMTFTPPSLHLA